MLFYFVGNLVLVLVLGLVLDFAFVMKLPLTIISAEVPLLNPVSFFSSFFPFLLPRG